MSRCREEKTSLTALITVLVARKLAAMYPTHSRFKGSVPFSMRKFTGHTPCDMGALISAVQPYFSSELKPPRGYISCRSASISSTSTPCGQSSKGRKEDEELWSSARACKLFIENGASSPANQNVGMLHFVTDFAKYFLGQLGTKRNNAFEVTNIGILDGGVRADRETEGDATSTTNNEENKVKERVTFDRVMFSGSLNTQGEPFLVATATAKNGFMTVAICWATGVVSDEEAADLKMGLEQQLRELGE